MLCDNEFKKNSILPTDSLVKRFKRNMKNPKGWKHMQNTRAMSCFDLI